MSTLRVIVDQILAPVPGGVGRYAEELTRALIATAPSTSDVAGFVSAASADDRARVLSLLPGLSELRASSLSRRELSLAWQYGLPFSVGSGMVHAMSPFAPLATRGSRSSVQQLVVTVHDAVPWTHPETLTPRGARWHRAMIRRAERYADAVVVSTHAVAAELADYVDLGDRVRVIGAAVSSALQLPADAETRAVAMDLPPRYLLSVGTLEPRKGLGPLIEALARIPDIPLLVVGPAGWGDVRVEDAVAAAGIDPERVRALGRIDDADLAVAMHQATVFVFPSLAEGFGLPVLEAFSFGVPVVHSDAPALVEVADGAGIVVEREPAASYASRLADAIRGVLDDDALRARLAVAGADRAKAFSWRDSAEKVWQLHADL